MKKINSLLITISLIFIGLGITSCQDSNGKKLLKHIPQEAGFICHLNADGIIQKANLQKFEDKIGENAIAQLQQLQSQVDLSSALIFSSNDADNMIMILASVKDHKQLLESVKKMGLGITEKDGYSLFGEDGISYIANSSLLWAIVDNSNFEKGLQKIAQYEKLEKSALEIQHIEKILKGDIGVYFKQKSLLPILKKYYKGYDKFSEVFNREDFKDYSSFANCYFEKKDIRSEYEVFNKEGEPFILKDYSYTPINKELLAFIPKAADLILGFHLDNALFMKELKKIEPIIKKDLPLDLLKPINGSVLLGAKVGSGILMTQTPEFAGLFIEVEKGKEKECLSNIIKALGIDFKQENGEYLLKISSQMQLHIGYKEGFIYTSLSSCKDLKENSIQDDELLKNMNNSNSYFLIDMRKGSTIASLLPMFINYPLDGYIEAYSMENKGICVFHNEASTEENILEGLLKVVLHL